MTFRKNCHECLSIACVLHVKMAVRDYYSSRITVEIASIALALIDTASVAEVGTWAHRSRRILQGDICGAPSMERGFGLWGPDTLHKTLMWAGRQNNRDINV